MKKLLGFQLADRTGTNIQGDDTDPLGLASFEIMPPHLAVNTIAALPSYLLMPIFEGDIEEPTILPETTRMSETTVLVPLTMRELVLIRVALLQRLDRLKKVVDGVDPVDGMGAQRKAECQQSYDQIRTLFTTKLWDASKAARLLEFKR